MLAFSLRWQRDRHSLSLGIHNVWDRLHFDPTYDPDIYYDVTRERRSVSLQWALRF